ncbi:MAG: hypothetical protein KDF59_08260 [Nitrosomonas sp.]|nr:hypothetical protein [Nitrosomonas sp.]
MPSAREIIGNIVALLFYFGIASTLLSFTTHLLAHEINNPSINHTANPDLFTMIGGRLDGD